MVFTLTIIIIWLHNISWFFPFSLCLSLASTIVNSFLLGLTLHLLATSHNLCFLQNWILEVTPMSDNLWLLCFTLSHDVQFFCSTMGFVEVSTQPDYHLDKLSSLKNFALRQLMSIVKLALFQGIYIVTFTHSLLLAFAKDITYALNPNRHFAHNSP